MGCIRVDKITEYLCEPLRKCLKDEDPYVRKTAAVCVAKLHDINAQLVEDQGFLDTLKDLISDSNPMVIVLRWLLCTVLSPFLSSPPGCSRLGQLLFPVTYPSPTNPSINLCMALHSLLSQEHLRISQSISMLRSPQWPLENSFVCTMATSLAQSVLFPLSPCLH